MTCLAWICLVVAAAIHKHKTTEMLEAVASMMTFLEVVMPSEESHPNPQDPLKSPKKLSLKILKLVKRERAVSESKVLSILTNKAKLSSLLQFRINLANPSAT